VDRVVFADADEGLYFEDGVVVGHKRLHADAVGAKVQNELL